MSTGRELSALIESRKREGWSYRKIAALTDGLMSSSQVHKLATQPRKHAPPPDQLRALAKGLQMPEALIFEAANKDWTTPPNLLNEKTDEGLVVIASKYGELSEDDRQTVLDLTDTLYRRMKEQERRRASQ